MRKETKIFADIEVMENFIRKATNDICKSNRALRELEEEMQVEESNIVFSVAKKHKLMPIDVFPSACMMNELFTLLVEVDLGNRKKVVEAEGYFIYECNESFWCLSNSLDKPYKILAWLKK